MRIKSLVLAAVLSGTALTAPQLALADQNNFVVDLVNEPATLDPHLQWNPDSYYVYRNIFDNLVTRSNDGEIVPQVATAWEYLSPTEIAFTLRDDITFHDGSKLTAEDVAFSIARITDPDFKSPQLSQYEAITGTEVLADGRVKITTNAPYPALLAQLVKLSIVPKAVVESVGNEAFNLSPVGSGPYKFAGWDRGIEVRLERNDAYWGDKGAFPKATFRAVPDISTRVANLKTGATDLIVSVDPDTAAQLESDAGVDPRIALTERVAYMRINSQKPGLDDVRLRRAIAHAIDKELIIEGLLGGYDKPLGQMLSPAHAGWAEGVTGVPFDLEAAKALVAEVGDAAKRPLSFATSPAVDPRIVQAIQQMLGDVGLTVEIEASDMAAFIKKVRGEPTQGPDFNFGRWSCACGDADGVLYPLLHSSSSWSVLRNEDLNKTLEAARVELDPAKRDALYAEVHEFVTNEVPLVPLYQAAIIYGATDKLTWQPTPDESMFLNRMSWSE